MPALSDYTAGTITLTNGSTAFTGSGTGWQAADFREGDTILGIEANGGAEYVVEAITGNAAGTLTQPWEGASGTYTYRMRYLADGARVTAQARELIELLGNGNLQALAGLTGPGVPVFNGPHAMVVRPETDFINGVAYDVQVDTLADRAAYDGQTAGFAVLVSDVGDGRSAIYSKASNTSGDWSDPAYVTGPVGPSSTVEAGTTATLPPGSAATVTDNPIPGGISLDFGIPAGEGFYWQGTYDLGTSYGQSDVVRHNGSAFIALQAVPIGESPSSLMPPVDSAYWAVLANKGQDGTGTGDVVGPSGAVADRVAVYDTTTGKLIKDGGKTIAELEPARTLVPQAVAEAGTSTDIYSWNPERVGQAILALSPPSDTTMLERNQALALADSAKALLGYRRYIDTVAIGFKAVGDADASSANGAVDTAAGCWKPTVSGTTVVANNPSTSPGALTDLTYADRSLNLVNGVVVQKVGVYTTTAGTMTVKIVKQNSSANFDIVVSQNFSHPGGGWADCTLTSPYTVPGSGTYNLAAHYNASSEATVVVARSTISGNPVVQTGLAGWSAGNFGTIPMRYVHSTTINNATLITPYQTADAARSKAQAIFEIDPVDAITLGTDWTVEYTCNGGTNWTAAATYTNCGKGQAGRTIIETDEVTCTSGTSFAARIKNLNNKQVNVHKATMRAAA